MTRRNLEIFVAVVECGKMSEAARKLYITQSSVSQAIAEIEREYHVTLFERLSRSLYLTDTGRELLVYARRILEMQAELDQFLAGTLRSTRLRIGATVTVGTCVISPILTLLHDRCPDVRTEVFVCNTHRIEEKLLHSELDVALVEGRIHHPDLRVQQAIRDKLVVICPMGHPFCGREAIAPEALAGQPLLLREEGSGTREQFEMEMKRRRIPIDVPWNCSNTGAIINGVIAGHGISVISKRLVEEDFRAGRLWLCDLDGVDMSRSFDLVLHNDKYQSDVLHAFMDICVAYGQADWPQ